MRGYFKAFVTGSVFICWRRFYSDAVCPSWCTRDLHQLPLVILVRGWECGPVILRNAVCFVTRPHCAMGCNSPTTRSAVCTCFLHVRVLCVCLGCTREPCCDRRCTFPLNKPLAYGKYTSDAEGSATKYVWIGCVLYDTNRSEFRPYDNVSPSIAFRFLVRSWALRNTSGGA